MRSNNHKLNYKTRNKENERVDYPANSSFKIMTCNNFQNLNAKAKSYWVAMENHNFMTLIMKILFKSKTSN